MVQKKYLIIAIIAIILVCVGAGIYYLTSSATGDDDEKEMREMISNFGTRLQRETDASEQVLMQTAQTLAEYPANDPEVARILLNYYVQAPSSTGVVRIDENGNITAAAPATQPSLYKYLIPSGYLEENLETSYGVSLDHLYNIETGTTQIVLGAPIFRSGAYTGMVTAIYNPMSMFGSALSDVQDRTGYNIWVINDEGIILYSGDSTTIGTNLRSTATIEWPELVPIVPEILQNKSGVSKKSAYSYLQLRNIDRIIVWDTINKWDEDLTIIMANDVSGGRQISLPTKDSGLTLEQYAISAYRYVKEHGKEEALAEFNNPNGRFFTSDFMFAALDMNEVLLADIYRSDLVGVSRTNYLDDYSVPINRMITMRALQGGGYTLFLYPDPQSNMETRMLIGYVMPIDDDWYIYAGSFYDEPIQINQELKQELVKFTRSIHQFIDETGREAALASLNNENEQFLHPLDIQYGVFDYNGTALSWPNNPNIVGQDALGVTDIYGGSIIRDMIMYAKEGGGFMYQYYPDAVTGESSLKLVYVEPLGSDWFLAANIPIT